MNMRKIDCIDAAAILLSVSVICGAGLQARAADLGGKPPAAVVIAPSPAPSPLAGCFIEGSTNGQFLAQGDRLAHLGAGFGCDSTIAGMIIVGGTIRADFGDTKGGSLQARAGMVINPNLVGYGFAEWRVADWHVANNGALAIGAGAETSVGSTGLSAFAEGSLGVAQIAGPVVKDDVLVRLGVRYRLN